jgi:RimJ/RimL family protein N-acetyltransferase
LTAERPEFSVEGFNIAVGPMRRDLIPHYQAWINDVSTLEFLANRRCELGIMIGEPELRNKRLGTECVRLAVENAFHVLNLHRVMLERYGFNVASAQAYARAGFREIGRRLEARYRAEPNWDVIMMNVLVSVFESPRLKAISTRWVNQSSCSSTTPAYAA